MGFLPVFPLVVSKIIDKCLSKAVECMDKGKAEDCWGVALGEDLTLLCSMETRSKPFELPRAC